MAKIRFGWNADIAADVGLSGMCEQKIIKLRMSSMVELVPATRNDLAVMQAMGSYFVYDMSEFLSDLSG